MMREVLPSGGWHGPQPKTLSRSTTYLYDSTEIGDRLEVTVAEPTVPVPSGVPRPTVYVLDPIATFDVVVGVTRSLAALAFGAFPPLLVVGVGYPTEDLARVMSLRTRDLTPTAAAPPTALAAPTPPVDGVGGAAEFMWALADEVIPFVEERHGGDGDDRTLVGWSLGGLFALYAMFSNQRHFRRYLLASPSMWWDDGYGLRAEAAYASKHGDLPAQVYLAVGEHEDATAAAWPRPVSEEAVAAASMVGNVLTLAERLRARGYEHLSVRAEVLPGEHHVTVFPVAAARGLRHLFCADTE